MMRPNQDGMRFGNRYHINQWGMRSPNLTRSKSDRTSVRILLIGDSVPNGGVQTDQDSLVSSILAAALTKAIGRTVEVANISAASWGPPNELAYLRRYGTFGADIAVVVLSGHDYDDWPTFDQLDPGTHPTKPPAFTLWDLGVRYLPRYLPALAVLQRKPEIPYKESLSMATHTLDSLSAMFALLHECGAFPVVVRHFARSELEGQNRSVGHDSIASRATAAAVLEFSDSLVMKTEIDAGHHPYRDDIHPNATGQRILAQQIFRIIEPILAGR